MDATKKVISDRVEGWLADFPDNIGKKPVIPEWFRYSPMLTLAIQISVAFMLILLIIKYILDIISNNVSLTTQVLIGINVGMLVVTSYQDRKLVARTNKNIRVVFLLSLYGSFTDAQSRWEKRLEELSKLETERFLTKDEIEEKKKWISSIESIEGFAKTVEEDITRKEDLEWYKSIKEKAASRKK